MKMNRTRLAPSLPWIAAALGCLGPLGLQAAAASVDTGEASFRSLYKELVEINTTLSSGSCTEAAEAMAARLQAAGMPRDSMQVLAPPDRPKSGALIAELPGSDRSLEPAGAARAHRRGRGESRGLDP